MKKLALILVPVVLVVSGLLYWFVFKEDAVAPTTDNQTTGVNQIDYSPSTEEDAEYVEDIKQDITQNDKSQDQQPAPTEASIAVTKHIVSGGRISVGAQQIGFTSSTCDFRINDGSIETVGSAQVVSANGVSGCNTSIDISGLNQESDWTIFVTATDNGQPVSSSQVVSKEER